MRRRILAAVVLLAIGFTWLLDMLGQTIFPGGFAVWWPGVLILVGLVHLVTGRPQWRGASILILLGGLFLLWTLGYLPRDMWKYAGPIALIVVAVLLLVPHGRADRPGPWREEFWSQPRRMGAIGPEDVAVFMEHRLESPAGSEYKGGELTAVFGSLEADFTRATLPAEGARLKATSVFGSVRIRVPPDWRVEVHGGGRSVHAPRQGPRRSVPTLCFHEPFPGGRMSSAYVEPCLFQARRPRAFHLPDLRESERRCLDRAEPRRWHDLRELQEVAPRDRRHASDARPTRAAHMMSSSWRPWPAWRPWR